MKRRDFLKLFPALAAYVALPAVALDDPIAFPSVPLRDKFIVEATAYGSGTIPDMLTVFHGGRPIMTFPVFPGRATARDMFTSIALPKISSTSDLRVKSKYPCVVKLSVAHDTGSITDAAGSIEQVLLIGEGA